MRFISWFFLTVSFLLGLASAFVVAYFTFDAKPVEVYDPGPTVKILVTKREIPRGAEIGADAILFEEAPASELPEEVLTNFAQVYQRRAAFPIPEGYPVCKDFLLSKTESEKKENIYLPPGSQLVSLEVEQLRLGDSVSQLQVPISQYISTKQKIDIRAVPKDEPRGIYVQRRQELLRKYGSGNRTVEDGEIVLANIGIHQIVGDRTEGADARQVQTLTLILDNEDAEKLMSAAQNGRLRIIPLPSEIEKVENINVMIADNSDVKTAVSTPDIQAPEVKEPEVRAPEEALVESKPIAADTEIAKIDVEIPVIDPGIAKNEVVAEVDAVENHVAEKENEAKPTTVPTTTPAAKLPVTETAQSITPTATFKPDFFQNLSLSDIHPEHEEADAPLKTPVAETTNIAVDGEREPKKQDAIVSFGVPAIVRETDSSTTSEHPWSAPEEAPITVPVTVAVQEQEIAPAPKRVKPSTMFQFIGSRQAEESGSTGLAPAYSPFNTHSRQSKLSEEVSPTEDSKENDGATAPKPLRSRNDAAVFVR